MPLLATKEGDFTYGQYATWPNDQRWELINGTAYNVSPAPSRRHQKVVSVVHGTLFHHLKDKPCKVYVAPFDVRLPEGDEADEAVATVVQPDVLVVCDASKLDEKGVRGAPELVVEVLSPSTSQKEQTTKKILYERFQVKEYWLLHPTDELVYVYELEKDKYNEAKILGVSDTLFSSVLPGFQLPLIEVFPQ